MERLAIGETNVEADEAGTIDAGAGPLVAGAGHLIVGAGEARATTPETMADRVS